MKHFKLFLLLLAILATGINGANAQNIYGDYTGTVHATSSLLGIDETLDGVTEKKKKEGSENFLRFEEFDFGGFPIALELDNVIITPSGNGYSISRQGEITIPIPEITIPPYPPIDHVTVKLISGSVENNVMELIVKISTTVMLGPIPIPLQIADVEFEGSMPFQEPEYDPVAVACINAMIDNNGLQAEKDKPEDWEFAGWNADDPMLLQLQMLDLDDEGLSGTLSLIGLARLESLECRSNNLTGLILTGCPHLEEIYCTGNRLTAIDLSGLDALTDFIGDGQSIELTLDNDGNGNYTYAIPLNSPTFTESAISYEAGILKSTDPTVALTYFTVETGNSDFQLSGGMFFTYTGVGIAETLRATSIRVYPNPTNNELRVTSDELQVTSIEVFDAYGKKLSFHHLITSSSHHLINISHLPAGVYFLRVDTEKGAVMQKVVKQ
jgi:hypothetical protein